MSLVLAIDQGTTSSRCIVFDRGGTIVAVAQREHRHQGQLEEATARVLRVRQSGGVLHEPPAAGKRVRMSEDDFEDGRLDLAGWDKPWFSVLPG